MKKVYKKKNEAVANFPEKVKNPMEIITKWGLDTREESLFYIRFFQAVLENKKKWKTANDLYKAIVEFEQKIVYDVSFYPSVDFNFIEKEFLMSFLPLSVYLDLLETTDFKPSVSKVLGDFIRTYRYQPLEELDALPDPQKAKPFKDYMKFLTAQQRIRKAERLDLDDYKMIRKKQQTSGQSFEILLRDFDMKLRTKFIHKDGSELPVPSKVAKARIISAAAKFSSFLFTRYPFVSMTRPWMSFESMMIRSLDNNTTFYGKELKKEWFAPSSAFHQEYVLEGSKQRKKEFISKNGHRFYICYRVGGTGGSSSWAYQEEALFAKEQTWLKSPTSIPKTVLRKLKNLQDIPKFAKIQEKCESIVSYRLSQILGSRFHIQKILEMLRGSVADVTDPFQYIGAYYKLIGRLDPVEPLTRFHGSLPIKLQKCFLRYDSLLRAPNDLVFPELRLYDPESQLKIQEGWKEASKSFVWRILQGHFKDQLSLQLEGQRPAKTLNVEIQKLEVETMMFMDGEWVDVAEMDSPDEEHDYLDVSMIPDGLEWIGTMTEAPPYYYTSTTKAVAETCNNPRQQSGRVMTIKDVMDFLTDLESGTEVTPIEGEDLGEEEENEEKEILEPDRVGEEDLEEVEIDLEEFGLD
jgi:hypothetical protein